MMRRLAKRVVIGAVLIVVPAMVCGTAIAQGSESMNKTPIPRGNFYDACPPDRRVEFVVGSLSLFVDPHWLALESEIPMWQRFGANCPSQPITTSKLYFNGSILDAANIPDSLGQPFLFFLVRNEAELPPGRMRKLDLADGRPLRQTTEPYIEDVTRDDFRANPHASPSARVYRLVYPGIGDEPPTMVDISCGGDQSQHRRPGPGRTCFTPIAYSYLGKLSVKYEFRQDYLPIVEAGKTGSSGSMSEPDGVLAFDERIRAWLAKLTKRP